MIVNVRQKDIDKGVPNDNVWCAIGCALMRKFKTTDVSVYYDRHCCDNDGDEGELTLRVGTEYYDKNYIDEVEHINNFIHWFDNGETDDCKPFEFKIDTSRTTI